MQGLQLGFNLPSHQNDLKKDTTRAFNSHKEYTLSVDFNYSQRIGRELTTFSTSTTIKNANPLRDDLALLHHIYANYNGQLSTYVSSNKFVVGNIGGGRLDLRQGSLLLMVRFAINASGEVMEEDRINHPVGKILTQLAFTIEKNGHFYMKNLHADLKVVASNE